MRCFGNAYVLNGGWEYGLNVFALTAAIMIICVVSTITIIVQQLLHMLAGVFGARGETMCRLLSSFIKYATIICMVYYCLMLIGIDTTTLLASSSYMPDQFGRAFFCAPSNGHAFIWLLGMMVVLAIERNN